MTEKNKETTKQIDGMEQTEAKIRFGLTTIKNFGEGIAESIIDERKAKGLFTSVADFLTRVTGKNLNKKSLEALIMTGCFDRFEERGVLLHNLETLLAFHKEQSAGRESSQESLFGGLAHRGVHALVLKPAPNITKIDRLRAEKELLGVYVSGHPLDAFEEEIKKRPTIAQIRADGRNGIPVITAGMVESVRELLTKKGDRMAFVMVGDKDTMIEIVAFPEVFQSSKDLLVPGTCVAIKGRLSIRNDEPTIALEKMKALGVAHDTHAHTHNTGA